MEEKIANTEENIGSEGEIAIGMSGGVDSSVTAYLLKQQGHHILGVTFSFFAPCGGMDNTKDAKAVAEMLGIAHCTADLSAPFSSKVITPFMAAYCQGETPNPCMLCNQGVKFGPEALASTGASGFATGHYAKVEQDVGSGRFLLKKGKYPEKDQSYFLAGLGQSQLAVAHFPLGDYKKEEIREIAKEANLPTATRSESQDICFIPDGDYAKFIVEHIPDVKEKLPAGPFVDTKGKVLGTHEGIISYTVGQRRGLGISSSGRLYVGAVNPQDNTVLLCSNEELFSSELTANRLNFIAATDLQREITCEVKIRSRHNPVSAVVQQIGEDQIRVRFDTPQRAVTPGQAVVLYDGDVVLASGVIQGKGQS